MADLKTLKNVLKAKIKGEKIKDDKTMIMERVIQLVSNLPNNSRLREELTNTFVAELWDSLEHPPLLYAGEKYNYRQADGSNNVCPHPVIVSCCQVAHCHAVEHHLPLSWCCWHLIRAICQQHGHPPRRPARPEFDLRRGYEARGVQEAPQ